MERNSTRVRAEDHLHPANKTLLCYRDHELEEQIMSSDLQSIQSIQRPAILSLSLWPRSQAASSAPEGMRVSKSPPSRAGPKQRPSRSR